MEDDDNLPKKTVTRKKLVDLKAVAALLEDGENPGSSGGQSGSFRTSEDTIAATARIKSQRDLIAERIRKMESGRDRVTKAVFDKVHRDYQMQLDNITGLLNEKKALLKRELKRLYLHREKQAVEITRHKEILEEARFRHFLDEFSEEQYKEVEEYETREISGLQSELAQIVSYIKVHEELFDPEDLGYAQPPKRAPSIEVTRTMMPERGREQKPEARPDAFAEKTPLPEKMEMPLLEEAPPIIETPSPVHAEEEILMDSTMSGIRVKQSTEEKTGSDIMAEPEEKGYFEAEPKSIFDVLETAPRDFAPETSETSRTAPLRTPLPVPAAPQAGPAVGAYKLVFTANEGDDSLKEFLLKDNVSIGRSPSNDMVLQTPKISRQHAAINKYKDQYLIIDLKSSNGVFVNGKKVDEQTLHDGDEINIGGYRMIFQKV